MSVEIPKVAVVFGSVTPPQGDVIQCRVHLGCTKEVSSFEVLLQNWNKKYSPSGTYPINVGMDGSISIGRGANCPQIITCRVESVKYESTPTENYLRVSGRCWGERLFRRVFTGTFENMKGEDIVKHLLDYYVGLSHVRDGTELVENTDTTYTKLEYEDTPVFDIIKYIAESADKNGVIGYDFRIAPDAKFEFFPRNSKTSPVSLSEKIEEYEYRKDIHGIRNKITVYGASTKQLPSDINDDGYTESTSGWSTNGNLTLNSGHVTRNGQKQYTDSYSVEANIANAATLWMERTLPSLNFEGVNGLKTISFWMGLYYAPAYFQNFKVRLLTDASNYFEVDISNMIPSTSGWIKYVLNPQQPTWTKNGNPNWSNISAIRFTINHSQNVSAIQMLIDHLLFSGARYSATQEDSNSQSTYGLRELTETDEELYNDNECTLRAKAILNHLKNPTEHLTVKSTVIDYGNTPLLPGDKIHVTLPNENVDADFRIESVEYDVDAKTQTLEITLELGREGPLLADYLYALKSKTDHVSKYKIARLI
ncbi:MAG: hypothetical protein QXQ94_06400 [Candidatus Bathyarchaeia archaeon]